MPPSSTSPARPARKSDERLRCPQCGALVPRAAAVAAAKTPHEPLSQAQFRVLTLLNLGFTTGEMASALNVTHGTVRWHLNHIFAKLHVRNRTGAIVRARELKLLP